MAQTLDRSGGSLDARARRPRPPLFRRLTPALGLLLGGHLLSDQVFAYLYIAWIPVLAGEVRFGIGIVEAVRVCSQWRHVVATSPVLKILPVFVAVCCLWLFALVELGAAHTMVLHASRRMED